MQLLLRDNLDEQSGNQGENRRIAEPYGDLRRRGEPLHSVAFVIRVTGTVVGLALISGRFQVQGRDCVVISETTALGSISCIGVHGLTRKPARPLATHRYMRRVLRDGGLPLLVREENQPQLRIIGKDASPRPQIRDRAASEGRTSHRHREKVPYDAC